jgi:chorismate mutase-like protein
MPINARAMAVVFVTIMAHFASAQETDGRENGISANLCGLAQSGAQPPRVDPAIDSLLKLMKQRMLLMHDVARAKWNAKTPLADPDREKAMLRELAAKGRALGLDPTFTSSFFAAQIEASKLMQRDDFRRWEAVKREPFVDAPDLKRDLRPRIDALNSKLLTALAKARPVLRSAEPIVRRLAVKALEGEGITPEVRDSAVRPLTSAPSKTAAKKTASTPVKLNPSEALASLPAF